VRANVWREAVVVAATAVGLDVRDPELRCVVVTPVISDASLAGSDGPANCFAGGRSL
jgi:hypothetical protein